MLKKYGSFTNGTPSTDTQEGVFAILAPKAFNNNFVKWIDSIRTVVPEETRAINGKTMRGSKPNKTSKKMPHIVSAFAVTNCQ